MSAGSNGGGAVATTATAAGQVQAAPQQNTSHLSGSAAGNTSGNNMMANMVSESMRAYGVCARHIFGPVYYLRPE